ncbi:MAG: TraK family protein, partial [Planctomycetota bacterium]|nr:TraK family protein [Planctomycetota bacterium]
METLLDRLRKKHTTDNARKNRHVVTILAHRDEIVAALNDGWSARKIWELMVEDNMTTMSYASFCRHVKTKIMLHMDDADGAASAVGKSAPPAYSHKKATRKHSTKKSNIPTKALTEKERLDILK